MILLGLIVVHFVCCLISASENVCSYIKSSCGFGFNVVDMTHTLGPDAFTLPSQPKFNQTVVTKGIRKRYNIWIESYAFSMAEHTGTHVDAPAHMFRKRPHIDEIPLGNLMGPGVVIDLRDKVALNDLYAVSLGDLLEWEARFGEIPDGSIVIVNTGWHRRYPNPQAVFNTDDLNNPETYRFPYWSMEAIEWLLSNRRIHAIGGDPPGVDFLNGTTLPVHKRLFRDCIVVLEGVANLDPVPPSGSFIFIPALKLFQGSGAPARIFALIPK